MATQSIPSGAITLFRTATAPTNWTTPGTVYNDYAIRIITSGTAATGGATAFSSVFASGRPVSGTMNPISGLTVGPYTLSGPQVSAHTHDVGQVNGPSPNPSFWSAYKPTGAPTGTKYVIATTGSTSMYPTWSPQSGTSGSAGQGQAHTHPTASMPATAQPFSGTFNFAIKYVDMVRYQRS